MTHQPIIIPAIAADGSLFPVEKLQAHRDALFHLAVSVFVFDDDALLIQKRAASKYHCGGLWANTCCSHPYWNEDLKTCAERRLKEELGFTVPLTEKRVVEYSADVGEGLHEHEKVTMFTASVNRHELDLHPDPEEVSVTRWLRPDQLRAEIAAAPGAFTPWLRIYVERFPELAF
ncbi:isopentenyl-diphosphate delta-isomerase [Roseibium sp. RKSG952]|uniref:isopentenyl-diphosphate delta-isomerase n=1 Tax=Roseibium sp. RKSG952 TaxID=2529384 RepID=UPI0012BC6BE4|nr:isopentenyl-diphosphate delta-isomerase [Roseibium sp. RKSG952]MTH98785.1 isopentenyl-diphosphate delta-isomerase [Roseibium sp. RKSG952]